MSANGEYVCQFPKAWMDVLELLNFNLKICSTNSSKPKGIQLNIIKDTLKLANIET